MDVSNDLFLSYRWADAPQVEPLLAALRARGVRVWQDAREVEDFASIQKAVATGLTGARALLAWYSTRYNGSRACQWELTAAYCAAQAEGDPRRRILVVNPEPCNDHVHLPELFDQLHLSAQGLPGEAHAVEALADRIQAALKDRVPPTPLGELRALTPPRWLPAMGTGSTRFVGRLPQMWELHGKLLAGLAAMLTGIGGKPGVALVRGAGGIGKSLMAEEYALRFGAAYPGGVFWIRAYGHPDGGGALTPEQRSTLRDAQVLDLAMGLGLYTRGLEDAQVRAALARHFDHAAQPFLWVIDDLPSDLGTEALGDWLAPHPLGRTLFTSRTRRFTQVPTLDLPQLDPPEARSLLTRGHPLSEDDACLADSLCAALGHHALAVDVCAALVARRGLPGTLQALERADRDVLELAAQFEEALPNGHQRHIAATFIASVAQLDEAARDVLQLAAVLAAAPIPQALLARCVAAAADLDLDAARDRTDLAIDRLLTSSLADDAGQGAIAVHTLVARTMRFTDGSSEAIATWRGHALSVLTEEMAQSDDVRRHAHLESWVDHARELSSSADDPATHDLLGRVARYDFERGAYALAHLGFKQVVLVRRRLLGEQHPDTLTAMNNLASTLKSEGDLAGARRLHEAVLGVRRRVLGEEHPDTFSSMNNLADALRSLGDLAEARRQQEALLKAQRRLLGDEHPDTLTSMHNLASTTKSQGDLARARRLQEAVLEARRRLLGEEHPDTLRSMSNLAYTLRDQGELIGARRLQESVLDAHRRLLGEEHPDTLTSMNNLASSLGSQGDLDAARRLQESALEARRRLLGEEHPDTLRSMSNLAITLSDQGDLIGARRLGEAVLEARRRLLGEEHPDTLTSMGNLAITLRDQGDLAGARLLEEATLDARRRLLGEEHPDTLTAMNNLAITLWTQEEPHEARRLQTQCVAGRTLALGPTHPETEKARLTLREMSEADPSDGTGQPT